MKSKSQIEAVDTHLGTGMSQSVVPIDKVPYEILGCIFEAYVEMDQSPWDLTLVSKPWRLSTMADPNLWRYVLIKGHYDLGRFHLARWKVEGKYELLDLVLRVSRGTGQADGLRYLVLRVSRGTGQADGLSPPLNPGNPSYVYIDE
jgi:hypothetical protein